MVSGSETLYHMVYHLPIISIRLSSIITRYQQFYACSVLFRYISVLQYTSERNAVSTWISRKVAGTWTSILVQVVHPHGGTVDCEPLKITRLYYKQTLHSTFTKLWLFTIVFRLASQIFRSQCFVCSFGEINWYDNRRGTKWWLLKTEITRQA